MARMPRRHRWEHLLRTPKPIQAKLDRVAQATLDTHGRHAFPSSIRYPAVDAEGQTYQTLDAYLRSLRWSATDARIRHERHGRCEGCGGDSGATTYHLCFEHIGSETDEELILLCGRCHDYLGQQQRVGRRYGGRVQPLTHWIWTTKQEHERIRERRRRLREAARPANTTPPATPAKRGSGSGETILLHIDGEPLLLDWLDP